MTLTHPDLHLRQQQQHAANRDQHHHHLQRPAHLLQYLPDLSQDRADIQQADRRELAVKLGQHAVAVLPAEAGQPALGLPVQRPGREDKEEVGPQALPVNLAQAGDFRAEVLRIAGKGHRITQPDVEAFRQPLLHRHLPRFRRPVAGSDRVMIRAFILPGQIQLAVKRFIFITLGRLTVNLSQARPHDGVIRLGDNLVLRKKFLQRGDLLRGDVDQEIVRAFRRELLLPAIQQVAAQH